MGIKWIISDIDGCLSSEASVAWDMEAFLEFARRVREANAGRGALAPMTLCTGRPQPYVELLMKLLDVRAPAIAENGAVFYSLTGNRARYAPGVSEEKLLGMRTVRAFIETEVLPSFPDAILQFGKEAQVSIFSENVEVFGTIQERIEAYLRERGGPELLINASHLYLNCSLKGVNKGRALEMLQAELGVSREQTAGIGDTVGDLPLRRAVGFFACPANAHEEIKAVADYIAPRPQIEGVLDILARPECRRA